MASSASPTPAPAASTATSAVLDKYLAFVKAHEIIIVELVAGLMIWFSTSAVLKRWDKFEGDKAKAAQAVVTKDVTVNKDAEDQISALRASIDASNLRVAKQLSQLEAQTNATLKADQSATVAEEAAKLHGTAVGNDVDLPLDVSRGLSEQIDGIPELTAKLDAANTRADSVTRLETSDQSLITGLNKQIGDQTKACTAQIAQLKVEKKQSWLHGFRDGFITGFIGGVILGHKL